MEVNIAFISRGRERIPALRIACENGVELLRPVQVIDRTQLENLQAREFDRLLGIEPVAPKPITVVKADACCAQHGSCSPGGMRKRAWIRYGTWFGFVPRFRRSGKSECWKKTRKTQYK